MLLWRPRRARRYPPERQGDANLSDRRIMRDPRSQRGRAVGPRNVGQTDEEGKAFAHTVIGCAPTSLLPSYGQAPGAVPIPGARRSCMLSFCPLPPRPHRPRNGTDRPRGNPGRSSGYPRHSGAFGQPEHPGTPVAIKRGVSLPGGCRETMDARGDGDGDGVGAGRIRPSRGFRPDDGGAEHHRRLLLRRRLPGLVGRRSGGSGGFHRRPGRRGWPRIPWVRRKGLRRAGLASARHPRRLYPG